MAKYLVGYGSNSWNFSDAYHAASNGDTIEFEKDYWFEQDANNEFYIKKNIVIEGTFETNDQGGRTFYAGAYAKFVITDGANVTFRNFWIDSKANKEVFKVEKKSVLNLETVIMTNTYKENGTVLVYVIDESEVNAIAVSTIKNDAAPLNSIKLNKGSFIAKNSNFKNRVLIENNSTVSLENCDVEKYGDNAFYSKDNSRINIKSSSIKGGDVEKNYPVLKISNSFLEIEDSTIEQENYTAAIWLYSRSKFVSKNNRISSISSRESYVKLLDENIIDNQIYIENESTLLVKGSTNIIGKMSKKIDMYIGDSVAIVNGLQLNRTFNPNIRVSKGAFLHLGSLENAVGSIDDINIEVSEDSILQKNSKSKKFVATGEPIQEEEQDALESINSLIGLNQVKRNIEIMINQVKANQKRVEQGLKPMKQTLNAVFMGNPGTGKTTVARLLGKALFDSGALAGDEFKFVEVSEPDLISQNIGGTAIQTKKYLDQARGGVLFIDEAYTLNKKGSSINFGQEAINTIMKYMEDYRDEIMIIFAGYTKEMEEFLKTNPGLVSRAPNKFDFEDYTADEIISLGKMLLTKEQFELEDEEYYSKNVAKSYNQSLDKSNGRWIRNFNEKLIAEQLNRVVKTNSDDVVSILNIDIDSVVNRDHYEDTGREQDAFEQLNGLIGLRQVKNQVQEFITLVETNQKREELGLKVDDFTLHSLFLGNPGTGKTTVARIIGKILYQKGIIATRKFIEVSRSDLVAGYIGQTAAKTREILESALGGVLFIDEAYTLYKKESSNDFGKEAIEEILKFMEDHRRDIVIILAGYTKEMGEFLQANSGLTSRIPTTFDFEDYSAEEISSIGILGLNSSDYKVDREYYSRVVEKMYKETNDKSNGRWIRNFNERLIRIASTRMNSEVNANYEEILNIDIDEMENR